MPIRLAGELKHIGGSWIVHHLVVGAAQLAQHPPCVELRWAQLMKRHCCFLYRIESRCSCRHPVSIQSVLNDANLSHCCCVCCAEDAGSVVAHGLYPHETSRRYSHSCTHCCMPLNHNQAGKQVARNSAATTAEQVCLTFPPVDCMSTCNSENLHCEQQRLANADRVHTWQWYLLSRHV